MTADAGATAPPPAASKPAASHIRLTSHPEPGAKVRFPIHWNAPTARERGPIIGTVSQLGFMVLAVGVGLLAYAVRRRRP